MRARAGVAGVRREAEARTDQRRRARRRRSSRRATEPAPRSAPPQPPTTKPIAAPVSTPPMRRALAQQVQPGADDDADRRCRSTMATRSRSGWYRLADEQADGDADGDAGRRARSPSRRRRIVGQREGDAEHGERRRRAPAAAEHPGAGSRRSGSDGDLVAVSRMPNRKPSAPKASALNAHPAVADLVEHQVGGDPDRRAEPDRDDHGQQRREDLRLDDDQHARPETGCRSHLDARRVPGAPIGSSL